MTIVIGVDPSSRKPAATWAPVGREDLVQMDVCPLPQNKPDACEKAYRWMRNLVRSVDGLDEIYVFIEAPVLGRGGPGSTIAQALIQGALLAGSQVAGAPALSLNNKTVKKQVVGNGNANKDMVAVWLKESWPRAAAIAGKDQDLIDSAMFFIYGRDTILRRERMAKYGNRIVHKKAPARRKRNGNS